MPSSSIQSIVVDYTEAVDSQSSALISSTVDTPEPTFPSSSGLAPSLVDYNLYSPASSALVSPEALDYIRSRTGSALFETAPYCIPTRAVSALLETTVSVIPVRAGSSIFEATVNQIAVGLLPHCANPSTGQKTYYSDQDSLIDSNQVPLIYSTKQILSVVSPIDGKVVGSTDLFTVPAGYNVLVTEAIIRATASVSVTVPATAGIGIAPGENDIVSSQILTNLISTGSSYTLDVGGIARIALPGEVIRLGIDIGAVGTSQTLEVFLMGFISPQ